MPTHNEKKHLNQLIVICFVLNFLLGVSPVFFGAKINTAQSEMLAKYLWQIANLFFVVGCCCFSIKSGSEDKLIAPAGFIVLSIGIGTLFALQTASFNEEVNRTYAAGIIAYIPGMILICYYDRFPIWLRIFGIVASVPHIITMILIMNATFDWNEHQKIDGLGYFLTNIVGLLWAWFAIKPMKKFRTSP